MLNQVYNQNQFFEFVDTLPPYTGWIGFDDEIDNEVEGGWQDAEGYYWQESREESWFCLACATCDNNIFSSSCTLQETCEEGMLLELTSSVIVSY